MLTNIQVVHVPVSDQDRALAFYGEALGMRTIADVGMGPHGRWLQVGFDGTATSLALVPEADSATPGVGLVLETDDIDRAVAALRERGVDLPDEIETMPWARAIRFHDHDGNRISLQTAAA